MSRAFLIIALVSSLTGCAGVFNPYVKPEMSAERLFMVPGGPNAHTPPVPKQAVKPEVRTEARIETTPDTRPEARTEATVAARAAPGPDVVQQDAAIPQTSGTPCDYLEPQLCGPLLLAEGYRVAYLRAASNQQRLRSGLALTGLAAATATLYYGLSGRDVFKDRVLRLGTLGAASYAAGTYFTSSPRQQVYLHGATAMSCAIIAAAPLMVPRGTTQSLREDLVSLDRELSSERSRTDVSSATKILDAIAAAESAYRDGIRMHSVLVSSGLVLRGRIELLANEVNRQTLAQLPDLNSLYSLAGSMSGFAQGFGVGRLAPAGAAPAANSKGGTLERSQEDSDEPSRWLLNATARVLSHLQFASAAAQTFDEVGGCSPDGIVDNFNVEPADAAVTVEKGKTFQFLVTDEGGHPSAKLSGASVEKVELQPVQSSEDNHSKYKVVIRGLDVTGQKGPTLLIRESNGVKVVSVALMVSAPAAAAPATDTAAPASATKTGPGAPRANEDASFLASPLRILAVQCTVGVDRPDCLMGKDTREAIKAYKEKANSGTQQNDSVDAALLALARKRKLDTNACSMKTFDCGQL